MASPRERKLETVILEAILNLDRLPELSGNSDAVIHAVDELIARLKAAMRLAVREETERDYAQRRKEAGVKAGRTVLFRWADELEVEITTTSVVASYKLPGYRYPEPVAFGHYEGLKEHSARLQQEAAAFLKMAYETGSPVPQEDVDQVRATMDAVQREEASHAS